MAESSLQLVGKAALLGLPGGLALGVADASLAASRGFLEPLVFARTVGFFIITVALLGSLGALCGAALGVALALLRAVGLDWSVYGGIRFGERRLAGATWLPALFVGAVGVCVAVLFKDHWVEWVGVGHFYLNEVLELSTASQATLMATLALVFAFLVALCSRRWMVPYGWFVVWGVMAIALGRLCFVEMYEASRITPYAYIHTAAFAGFVVFLVVGGLLTWHRWGALTARTAVVAIALAVGSPVVAGLAGNFTSHTLRTVLWGRTILTYRTLYWLPPFSTPERALLVDPDECALPQASEAPSALLATPYRGVVWITIDTLRPDRLGTERDGVKLTENLSRLARRGTRFTRAYATAPATIPSVGSMMTGRRVGTPRHRASDVEKLTLLRELAEAEVSTLAIPNNSSSFFRTGFERIHADVADDYDPFQSGVVADRVAETAQAALGTIAEDERFLMFVHFLDPHAPFDANPLFDFGAGKASMYDGEVAFTDRAVGELIDAVREQMGDDVAVVVVSDHGEELGDHGYHFHALRLYEESSRIVLLLDLPGKPPRTVDVPVDTTDVGPTLLQLLGVAVPRGLAGRSLLDVADSRPARDVFIWGNRGEPRALGLVRGDRKLIVNRGTGIVEFYDLAADPHERHNLADEQPDGIASMYCSLRAAGEEAGLIAP